MSQHRGRGVVPRQTRGGYGPNWGAVRELQVRPPRATCRSVVTSHGCSRREMLPAPCPALAVSRSVTLVSLSTGAERLRPAQRAALAVYRLTHNGPTPPRSGLVHWPAVLTGFRAAAARCALRQAQLEYAKDLRDRTLALQGASRTLDTMIAVTTPCGSRGPSPPPVHHSLVAQELSHTYARARTHAHTQHRHRYYAHACARAHTHTHRKDGHTWGDCRVRGLGGGAAQGQPWR